MFADLHIHSIFSDSTRTPEEIVKEAKNQNVSLISVCDHGSIDSYDRLALACRQNNITYVPGIEMSAVMNGQDYDILVYNFDLNNKGMIDLIKKQKMHSQKECEAMIVKMSADYSRVSLADYLEYEYPGESGGWKYLHYAVARKVFDSYEEAGEVISKR